MKLIKWSSSEGMRDLLAYLIAGLLVAVVLNLKIFLMPGVYGFDLNDDVNHTFVNLKMANRTLDSGELPLINLNNNFGTPLMGDALTYPFAPHSLIYHYLPGSLAMTINRSQFAVLTVLALGVFYRRYMGRWTATLCAVIAMANPGWIHHFAHHHFQTGLFWFMTLLLVSMHYWQSKTWWSFLWVQGVLILLWISVNLNASMIFTVLWVLWMLCGEDMKVRAAHLMVWLLGMIVVLFPELHLTYISIRDSVRAGYIYPLELTFVEYLRAFFGYGMPKARVYLTALYTAPMVGAGMIMFFKIKSSDSRDSHLSLRILLCGVLPFFFVHLLAVFPEIWSHLPLIQSTDVTRILWGSLPIALLSLGMGLEKFLQGKMEKRTVIYLILTTLVWTIIHLSIASLEEGVSWYLSSELLVILALLSMLRMEKSFQLLRYVQMTLIFSALLWSQWVVAWLILGYQDFHQVRNSHYFSAQSQEQNPFPMLMPYLDKDSRIGVDAPSNIGIDYRMSTEGILGSNARGIILDGKLSTYLLKHHLVVADEQPLAYHIRSEVSDESLKKLGIKYLLKFHEQEADRLPGWTEVVRLALNYGGGVDGKEGDSSLSLFRSDDPVSVACLTSNDMDLMNIPFKELHFLSPSDLHWLNRGVMVDLPVVEKECALILLFSQRPGWVATVHGDRREVYSGEDHFIRIRIRPGDRQLIVQYEPFSVEGWLGFIAIGILGISAAGFWLVRSRSSPAA